MANDISQASLNLNAEEKRVYGQLFQQADAEGVGVVTGDVAVKFFEKTRLDPSVLGEIWQIGDKENRGFLTPAGFSIVLRLIGHCQAGRSPSSELAMQSGPVPRFDGGAPVAQPAAAPLAQQQSGTSPPIRVPPLTPDKVADYSALFEKAGGRNGVLPGDGAKLVFERSRLPNDVLGQIWNLSDKDAKGTLNTTEFIVAMHLMASMRNGSMRAVPQTLPPGLYDAAQRRGPGTSAMGSVARQVTGQGPQRAQSPLSQSFGSPSMSAQTTGNDWLVTPSEKSGYDRAFASIDTKGAGVISGDQAVPFFSNSGLSEDSLATIWDLADIRSEGQLTRDEFAVAMYLIRQARGGAPLPATLPPGLIPPSMRQRPVPTGPSTAPNFENPAPAAPQQKSAADDLFGLDALSTEPAAATAPAPAPAAAVTPRNDPFASDTPASPSSPKTSQPQKGLAGTSFRPAFVPSSRFGQGLAAQNTGGSIQSEQSQPRQVAQAGADDLLGDTDPEVSKKFTSETTELANMSNQIGTLRSQMQEVQAKKSTSERDLAANSSQKQDLETRLAQFRTQYEEEVRAVKSLESRLTTSRAETSKLSQDLAMLEGTHADLRTQHEQLRTAYEADQRENAELKEKIRILNSEVTEMRPVLEKLRNDARQQKGMAAINKKQLSTTEGEREKLQNEKADLEKTISEKAVQPAETSRDVQAFDGPSPAASVTSQNTNPFFRSMSPQQTGDNYMSPSPFRQEAPGAAGQSNFDSFFSQPGETASRAGPASATSFGAATTAAAETKAVDSVKSSTPPPPASATSGFQTPTAAERSVSFETPTAIIPPPPPQSRQITSSSLPLRSLEVSSDSPTSSVKANPPASRSGLSDFAGPSASALTQAAEEPAVKTVANDEPSSIPGAFPGEAESPVQPTPPALSGDHFKLVSGADISRDASNSKADFDSAFGSSAPTASKAVNGTHGAAAVGGEFPPIQDIEQDESDSEEEGGFADSFSAGNSATAGTQSTKNDTMAAAKEAMPPPLESQSSPPAYEASDNKAKESNSEQFPKEYTGLLPPRESSQGSPEPPHPSILAAAAGSASPPDSNSHPVSAELRGPTAAKASTQPPADEFDSAFDDLDEAKEDDDQAQEGFSFGGQGRSKDHDEDFNPTFDSPIPSKTNTMSESVQHTPTTSTGRAFEQHTGSTFGNSTSPFSTMGTGQTQASTATTADSGHDWDAIFAGLDKPVADSALNSSGAGSAAFGESTASSSRLAAPGGDKSRPSGPARAISTGTEHDDPILKTLTSMGYPRDKALLALEKYDYNLDRAADYLTSGK